MVDFVNAVNKVKAKYKFDIDLKEEQEHIIKSILAKKDVFGLLPTGFGKSMTYIAIPLILDELEPHRSNTSLVISPLKTLMADQVEYLKRHNVKAAALMDETAVKDIIDSQYSVLFTSPEAANQTKWRNVLREHYTDKITTLVFDEAHCISSWGLDFRPHYRQVQVLQSFFDVPNLVLTATATKKIQTDIYDVLGFQSDTTEVVAVLPDRPNIFIDMKPSTEKFENELIWLLDNLKKDEGKKIILYVRSLNLCYQIYLWLVTTLEDKTFVSEEPTAKGRRIEMFHANTDQESKDRILEQFLGTEGNIKLLITTVAFGMGVNITDVDIVIHWGIPTTFLSYWQEIGRCARDGRNGYAICYGYKRSLSKCEEDELKDAVKQESCLRTLVLQNFLLEGMNKEELKQLAIVVECCGECQGHCDCKRCKCCIVCQQKCPCGAKCNKLEAFLG